MAPPRGRPTRYRVLSVAKLPFLDELTEACAACDPAQALASAERDRQVEDAFFRAAVGLEAFLSEWLTRCLSFDASHLQQRADQEFSTWLRKQVNALEGPTGRRFRAYVRGHTMALAIPRRPTLTEALQLFGSAGDVVGVTGAKDLEKKARDNLTQTYAVRAMRLTARQRAVVDATKKVRNSIAHGSSTAVSAMNDALRNNSLPASLRRGSYGVARSGIGRYLSARPSDQRRYAIFFNELARAADDLCKSRGRPRAISSGV
jgi:hypothetical protein